MLSAALLERFEIFAATATIGAHAHSGGGVFRQRDVKFLIDLFANWVETSDAYRLLPVRNTQVSRYLDSLSVEGFAKRSRQKRLPGYRLTRTGLIELLARLTSRTYVTHREHFFFLHYFIKNYSDRLIELVKAEGTLFPPSLKLELDSLLDIQGLIAREVAAIDAEMVKVQMRISGTKNTSAFVVQGLSRGTPFENLVSEVEQRYPYELNSQKPLHELVALLPIPVRRWELETGNLCRANDLWEPTIQLLECYRAALLKI